MSAQNVIKPLNFIENVFGIYRNHFLISERLKWLALCHVSVEVTILIICFLYYVQVAVNLYRIAPNNVTLLVAYVYCVTSGTTYSLVSIVFACLYSKHFKLFVLSIEAIKKLCENDTLFKAKIAIETKRFYIEVSVMSAFVISWLWLDFYDAWDGLVADALSFIIFVMGRILECRIFVESMVFYELSEIIGARLNYLNASILEVVEDLERDPTGGRELCRVREEIEKWSGVSKLLCTACDRLQDSFGAQITLSLYFVSLLTMALLYSTINFFINQKFIWESSIWTISLTMVLYLTLKVMILVSGQRVQREAGTLDTNLARLWRALLAIPGPGVQGCARAARSLQRRVRTTPASVRLHAALPTRMTLLVDILSTIVAYTIVFLQLNHVV